ncbi:MAG: dTDP-4-dehydrorhamnose 3,5-epimerase [Rhodospirillales bacterium]|jgi:dTDP-4-dehydrorhamnose 3,5-epimerase|nr:dTDP-4-dehydrorhamnose 3,5-epimerase [Rhodospirillales bacterium]MDP6644928.1 dTDP-4-dehydrorhamnose 3,5-epimerase [Rhodospirillales bacterium]|tara:strand:+ start:1736 stop:2290 length:555 start_codon:yes stop_codon:yes gene_type:complete
MRIEETGLAGLHVVHFDKFEDRRGYFMETFDSKAFQQLGLDIDFVLDATSFSDLKGTFRGLHYQEPPHARANMVRATKGKLFDVALDLRRGSTTFGEHFSITLSSGEPKALLLPAGFAHGFCTLEDATEVNYKLGDHYAPDHAKGVSVLDPDLKIDWPIDPAAGIMSDNDKNLPRLNNLSTPFT